MKLKIIIYLNVVLFCSILIFANFSVYAQQKGILPLGEIFLDDSKITQTKGEYSLIFEQNEHTIGQDKSTYNHEFEVVLEVAVFNFSSFSITFHFSTPFETLIGGSSSLAISEDLDFTDPSLSDKSEFKYVFTHMNSNFKGSIFLGLSIDTTDEMVQIKGYEEITIESINGTIKSEILDGFSIESVKYSTTLGPDNRFIQIDFFSVFLTILILPVVKKSRS